MRASLFITDKSIKIAKVAGGRPILIKVPLEEKIVEDGRIADEGKFAAVLSKIARQFNLTKTEVVLGISEKHIFSKKITLSDGEVDFGQKILDERESYLPSDASEDYTDWQVLEKTQDEETIFLASASTVLLEQYLSILVRCHIPIVGVEPLALAISRHVPDIQPKAKTAVPQTPKTPQSTLIVFLEEGEALLTVVNEKEQLELNSVLPQASLGHLNDLIAEISNMRSFYDKKTQQAPIGKVYLTGEGVTEDVKNQLAQQLNLPTDFLRIPNPRIPLQNALAFFPVFAFCDLPISSPKDHKYVNLLPQQLLAKYEREKNAAKRARLMTIATFCFGILCILYGALLVYLMLDIRQVGSEIAQKTAAISAGDTLTTRQKVARINKEIAIVKKFKEKEIEKPDVMSFLAEKTPAGITITHYTIDFAARIVLLTGQSLERDRLLAFKEVLETEGKYQNVNVPLTSLEKKGASIFSLSFEVP